MSIDYSRLCRPRRRSCRALTALGLLLGLVSPLGLLIVTLLPDRSKSPRAAQGYVAGA